MEPITGLILGLGLFFGGAALKENEIEKKIPPVVEKRVPTLIEQSVAACEKNVMVEYSNRGLSFACIVWKKGK